MQELIWWIACSIAQQLRQRRILLQATQITTIISDESTRRGTVRSDDRQLRLVFHASCSRANNVEDEISRWRPRKEHNERETTTGHVFLETNDVGGEDNMATDVTSRTNNVELPIETPTTPSSSVASFGTAPPSHESTNRPTTSVKVRANANARAREWEQTVHWSECVSAVCCVRSMLLLL